MVIGEDFNARTANRGMNRWVEGEDGETIRKSRDRILDKNGKILIEEIEEQGWILLNGNWEGDKDGEFTYIGKQRQSVIDYGVVNFQAGQNIE